MYKKYFDVLSQKEVDGVIRLSDNAFIPPDPANTDYQRYLEWLAVGNTPLPVDPPAPEQLQAEIVAATQQRLDDFARTRNYDGILSACTYATSAVPKFQTEGQYCVNARDNTWATLYTILGEVQAGTRPVPSGYEDIEGDLPALVWPAN
jgi:hypothetical protein